MKILFIEPCHINFGGYFRATNIGRGLVHNGCQVDILLASDKKLFFGIKKHTLEPGLVFYELPKFYFNVYIQGRLIRAFIAIIFGLFKKYDIIHLAMPIEPETNIPALFFWLIGKKNLVIDWDELFENGALKNNYLLHQYATFFEHLFPKLFKNYVVVSDILASLARQRGVKNINKTINAVNTYQLQTVNRQKARHKLKFKDNFLYFLTFGNTYLGQRVYLLFKTAEKIINLYPNSIFICNFDPEKLLIRDGFIDKIKKDTLKHFQNVGYIPDAMLGHYLSAADASYFLMEASQNDQACFPTRIGTYLCGESIIVTNDNQSEASRTLQKYDCAIIESDLDVLAKKAVNLLTNPQQLTNIKKNVTKAKLELSYDNITKNLVDFYQNILHP